MKKYCRKIKTSDINSMFKSSLIYILKEAVRKGQPLYQLTGAKGFANKYTAEGYGLDSKAIGSDIAPNHEI